MKPIKLFFLTILLLTLTGCTSTDAFGVKFARLFGARAKIVLHVVDDNRSPVEGANVVGWFYMNKSKDNPSDSCVTDKDGYCTLEERTVNDVGYAINKDGWYESRGDIWFIGTVSERGQVEFGKWLPYGGIYTAVLKPIKNPVKMHLYDGLENIRFPNKDGKTIGFDLCVGDWIKPYGKGKVSDCQISYLTNNTESNYESKFQVSLSFTNKYSGVCKLKKDIQSEFVSEYHANTNDIYHSSLTFVYGSLNENMIIDTRLKNDEYLIFRTRTVVDNEGRLVSANYGKIYGPMEIIDLLRFNGIFFNLTPNDTNLEDLFTAERSLKYKER